jgi:hypothetical protein
MKEMQIKITLRFHLTPVRMAIFKGNKTMNASEDAAKQKPLYTTIMGCHIEISQKSIDRTAI